MYSVCMGEILHGVRKITPVYIGTLLRRVHKISPICIVYVWEQFCMGYAKFLLYV